MDEVHIGQPASATASFLQELSSASLASGPCSKTEQSTKHQRCPHGVDPDGVDPERSPIVGWHLSSAAIPRVYRSRRLASSVTGQDGDLSGGLIVGSGLPPHGGNLSQEARRLGLRADQLLDASASLVPFHPPRVMRAALRRAIAGTALRDYPDRSQIALRRPSPIGMAWMSPAFCRAMEQQSCSPGPHGMQRRMGSAVCPNRGLPITAVLCPAGTQVSASCPSVSTGQDPDPRPFRHHWIPTAVWARSGSPIPITPRGSSGAGRPWNVCWIAMRW